MTNVSITPRRGSIVDRLERWLAGWLKAFKDVKAEAELRHKLQRVDDHLLRDMGLRWTGRRYEPLSRDKDRCL